MKIGVFVSAAQDTPKAVFDKAREIGRQIALRGGTVVTGACNGLPQQAVLGASAAGGKAIGFSPSKSEEEHKAKGWPTQGFSEIRYTGIEMKARNLLSVEESDIAIIVNGRIGTLNEFTLAYDTGKVIGVLKNSGGISNLIPEIIKAANKPTTAKVIYDEDPVRLVERVVDFYTSSEKSRVTRYP